MKIVNGLIILSLVIISICLIYLTYSGISLRTAPLIQPSVISADRGNIAPSVIKRLFQELQNSHYVLWGVLPETEESQGIMDLAAADFKNKSHQSVQFIHNAENASEEHLLACAKPCWLLVSRTKSNQLGTNNFIEKKLSSLQRTFLTLTVIPFHRDQAVAAVCDSQKRLDLDCLIAVSIREVHRKMKDSQQRYFFLRKYNENDYFLFIQQ